MSLIVLRIIARKKLPSFISGLGCLGGSDKNDLYRRATSNPRNSSFYHQAKKGRHGGSQCYKKREQRTSRHLNYTRAHATKFIQNSDSSRSNHGIHRAAEETA